MHTQATPDPLPQLRTVRREWIAALRWHAAEVVHYASAVDRHPRDFGPGLSLGLLCLRETATAAGATVPHQPTLAAIVRAHVNRVLEQLGEPALSDEEIAHAAHVLNEHEPRDCYSHLRVEEQSA